jgi:acetate kinase
VAEILVVNAGSTSLKLHLVSEGGCAEAFESFDAVDPMRLEGVAHRVVHGGQGFREPVLIGPGVREEIFELEAIAPLHNAPALAAIDAAGRRFPAVPHVAVFDTGFHATIPPEAATYAVPKQWREQWGIRRYGFHGLSVEWSAGRVPELLGRPTEGLRLVVCHLGGGSSVTAVRDGHSVDTTMGFSPLEGVPMTTRAGSVDPGALRLCWHSTSSSTVCRAPSQQWMQLPADWTRSPSPPESARARPSFASASASGFTSWASSSIWS